MNKKLLIGLCIMISMLLLVGCQSEGQAIDQVSDEEEPNPLPDANDLATADVVVTDNDGIVIDTNINDDEPVQLRSFASSTQVSSYSLSNIVDYSSQIDDESYNSPFDVPEGGIITVGTRSFERVDPATNGGNDFRVQGSNTPVSEEHVFNQVRSGLNNNGLTVAIRVGNEETVIDAKDDNGNPNYAVLAADGTTLLNPATAVHTGQTPRALAGATATTRPGITTNEDGTFTVSLAGLTSTGTTTQPTTLDTTDPVVRAYMQTFTANLGKPVGDDGIVMPGMRNPNNANEIFHNGEWVSGNGVLLKPVIPALYDPKSDNQFIQEMLNTHNAQQAAGASSTQSGGAVIGDGTISRNENGQAQNPNIPSNTQFPGGRMYLTDVTGKDEGRVLDVQFSRSESAQLAKTFPRDKFTYDENDAKDALIITNRETGEQVEIQAAGEIGARGNRISGRQLVTHSRKEGDSKEIKPVLINIVAADGSIVGNGINVDEQLNENSWAFYGPDPANPTQQKLYVQTRGADGKLTADTSTEAKDYADKVDFRSEVQGWYTAASKAQGWSQLSSLFCGGTCINDWAIEVDKIFHNAFLGGTEYWTEAICKVQADIEEAQDSAIFSLSEDGYLYPSASITATKQEVQTDGGTKFLYHVSYLLKNPEAKQSEGFFGSKEQGSSSSRNSGVTSRSSSGSQQRSLDTQERAVWNEVKTIGRTISSSQAQYSRTSDGSNMEYNIVFSGQRTVELLPEQAEIETGEEIVNTKEDAFATYSSYNYDRVCIVFTGEKPVDAFYEEVNEICADIADISRSNPTILAQVDQQAQENQNSGEFNTI